MRNKSIILVCCLILFGISSGAQAQTKIMEYNTGITIDPTFKYMDGAFSATPIGVDFLVVPVRRPEGGKSVYILDLKKKSLAIKFDSPGASYEVQPSATTAWFCLQTEVEDLDNISLYSFNKKNRSWNLVPNLTPEVTTGYATTPSLPVLSGCFVNSVDRSGILCLAVYKY
jgi:hypothetical protein